MNAVCEIIISLQLNISLRNDRKNAQHLDFYISHQLFVLLCFFVCFFKFAQSRRAAGFYGFPPQLFLVASPADTTFQT